MKLRSLLAVALLGFDLSSSLFAQSRVLTVDNNPGSVAMFRDFPAAYAAAKDGDTILLAGSDAAYDGGGSSTITKRLHLVGTGYLLSENGILGLSVKPSRLGTVGFDYERNPQSETEVTSEGSTLTGVYLDGVNASVGITLDRCRVGSVEANAGANGQFTVRRCLVTGTVFLRRPGSQVHNSILSNCHLETGTTAANCVFSAVAIHLNGMSSAEAVSISSSILLPGGPAPSPAQFAERNKASFTHCLAVGGSFLPVGAGNINGIQLREEVFLAIGAPEGDAFWQLKPGSPALGAGFNGVDMGVFGGSTPYILSGVPSRPRVTRFVVPAAVTSASGLRFEVDAQSF